VAGNVDPEEAQAILELVREERSVRSPAEVLQRDFREPRRFSSDDVSHLQRSLQASLAGLDGFLTGLFRVPHRVGLAGLREVSAHGLFDGLEGPFVLARFQLAGQPAWIHWQCRAAVASVETLLGAGGAEPAARSLSRVELTVLERLLGGVVASVAAAFDRSAEGFAIVKAAEDVGHWRDGGPDADPHRLAVDVAFEGPGEASTFHLYLPGFSGGAAAGAAEAADEPLALPPHLEHVSVDLSARLGANDVPLSDLLSLQEGDVIPLGTSVGDPVQLRAEGLACGTAELGSRNGRLAVRVLDIRTIPDPDPS